MFEKAAMRLYDARMDRDKTKEAFIDFREKTGTCEHISNPFDTACYDEDPDMGMLSFDRWCDVCKKGQPFYLARKAACKEVGMAMRALMQLCKKNNKAL